MTTETAKRSIDGLIASAVLYGKTSIRVKFAGGEPLLEFPLIRQIIPYARRAGEPRGIEFFFNIITNGTLLSKDILKFVKSEKVSVSVSLDGIEEYHNCQRGGFTKVEQGILLFKEYEIVPNILVTVSELNLPGLPQLTEYLLQRKLPFRFSFFRELDAQETRQSEGLMSFNNNAIKTLHKCYDIIEAELPEKELPQIHKLCDIDLTRRRKRNCGIGSNGIVIGHNGQIAICQALLDRPVGTVYDGDPLTSARSQKDFSMELYSIDQNIECNTCTWRYVCAGGCPLLTILHHGNFNARSPYCEIFKEMIPRLITIYGLQIVKKIPKGEGVKRPWQKE